MNSALLWFGGFLVAVFAALFAVPYFVDWNSYRGVFEEEATRVLGRKVRVGGSVNLRLLPVPYVRFEKVRIADNSGTLGVPFFSVDGFTLWLSVPPLLQGVVKAKQVELDGPRLNLAIDKKGRANWEAFQLAPGSMAFVPKDVALQSVKISDGRLSLRLGGRSESVVLSGVEGEFAADALTGPFRFRGHVNWQGQRYEVRFSTGQPETDGRARVKTVARNSDTEAVFVLDGAVQNTGAAPTLEGLLTAKVPIAGVRTSPGQAAAAVRRDSDEKPARKVSNLLDLKANLTADTGGFQLKDLLVSFESDGRPQLITGAARGIWRNKPTLGVNLATRWLDIDRIAGAKKSKPIAPLDIVHQMGGRLLSLVIRDWDATATLKVDQSNLGGDVVGDLMVELRREAGRDLIVRQFTAALPGGVRIRTSGRLRGAGQTQAYDGAINMHGGSLARFLRWASGQSYATTAQSDRPFSLSGKLAWRPNAVGITNATAELGPQQFQVSYYRQWGAKPALDIALDGDVIDIAPFAPGLLARLMDRKRISKWLAGPRSKRVSRASRSKQPNHWIERFRGDFRLNVAAGQLDDGETRLRNITAKLRRNGQAVGIERIAFTGPSGVKLDAKARLSGAKSLTGSIDGWLSAASPQAMASVAKYIGRQSPLARALADAFDKSRHLNVGFRTQFNGGRRGRMQTIVNGYLDDSEIQLSVNLGGGLDNWREKEISARLDISARALNGLFRSMGYDVAQPTQSAETASGTARPVRLRAIVGGANAKGLKLTALVRAPDLTLSFSGQGLIAKTDAVSVSGRARLNSASGRRLLGMVLKEKQFGVQQFPVKGTMAVRYADGAFRLRPEALQVADARVSGEVRVSEGKTGRDGKVFVRGHVDVTKLSLNGALAMLNSTRRDDTQGPWSDVPFRVALGRAVDMDVTVLADQTHFNDAVFLTTARGRFRANAKRIDIDNINGRFYDGQFAGKASLIKRTVGLQVRLGGILSGLDLAKLTTVSNRGRTSAAASGKASISVDMVGAGLSVRSAVNSLKGKGVIRTEKLVVKGLAANAVDQAVQKVLAARNQAHNGAGATTPQIGDNSPDTAALLAKSFRTALQNGRLKIGTQSVGLRISDGVVRIAPVRSAAADGVVTNTTTISLTEWRYDSSWLFRPSGQLSKQRQAAKTRDGGLPGVSLVYVGSLSNVLAAQPTLSSDALARELTVWRMERSVQRLERLRREDEERARREDARRRAIEKAKRRALRQQGLLPSEQDPWRVQPQSGQGSAGGQVAPGQNRRLQGPAAPAGP